MDTRLTHYHSLSIEEVVQSIETSQDKGLSQIEVEKRQARFGKNIFRKGAPWSAFRSLLSSLKTPFSILLICAAIATFALGETIDTIVICIALAINSVVGLLQEGRASRAFDVLNASQSHMATVVRDGVRKTVSITELVIGDIVLLSPGVYVPADVRLYSVSGLEINEASLTGESLPVTKTSDVLKGDVGVSDQINSAWMGTVVVSGTAKGIVVATGGRTEMGKIAEELGGRDTVITPVQMKVARVARFVSLLAVAAIIVIVFLGVIRGEGLVDMLLVAIAIAVSAVPEGLPAAVTVVLAIGMEKLLKRGGLVKNLRAAETLGSTSVIMTDKTGTLTEARMKISDIITPYEVLSGGEEGGERLLEFAILSSDAHIEEKDGEEVVHGRPLERAILSAGLETGLREVVEGVEERRLDYIVFSSSRKYSISLSRLHDGTQVIVLSGAPEILMDLSSFVDVRGEVVSFTEEKREHIHNEQRVRSKRGERILGIAYIPYEGDVIPLDKDGELEKGVLEKAIFMGLLSMSDPVRKDVAEEIEKAQKAGISIVMVTGDNPDTAHYIAMQVGLATDDTRVVHGREVNELTDKDIVLLVRSGVVFSRVTPEHKLRIAKVLRKSGEVVAMTGDGVNDAPALKSADIGIAIGSGTDVAKEASDLILLEDSFSVIVSAIEEGRRIGDNLKRIITHLLATSFGEILLIAGALLFALPLPILPVQILWLNIVEEGFLSFAFAFEPAGKGVMKRSPKESSVQDFLTGKVRKLILISGVLTGLFSTTIFVALYLLGTDVDTLRSLMFVILSFDALFFTLSLKDFETPLWRIPLGSNKILLGALGLSALLLVGAFTLPPLASLLSLVPIHGAHLVLLLGAAVINVLIIEITKYELFEKRVQTG